MKFPAELGASISIISDTVDGAVYPSVILEGDELALYSLPPGEDTLIIGSEANAGGGPRGSVTAIETG